MHFLAVELDNVIWFSTLPRISWLLCNSSKLVCQFSHFLQPISGIEVLACSLDINPNYASTILQLPPSLNHKVFGRILKDRHYVTQCCLLDLRTSAEFTGKMHRFLRSLAEYLAALAFLCSHCMFDSYITCLTISFNTVYMFFHSH